MYGALLLFLSTTKPTNLPVILLLVPLTWLFVCLLATIILIAGYFRLNLGNESIYKQVSYASLLALIPTGLLLLQSINQLTAKDIMLCIVFAVIALVYVRRFRLSQKSR